MGRDRSPSPCSPHPDARDRAVVGAAEIAHSSAAPHSAGPRAISHQRGSDRGRDWNAEGAAGFAGGPQGPGVQFGGEILE